MTEKELKEALSPEYFKKLQVQKADVKRKITAFTINREKIRNDLIYQESIPGKYDDGVRVITSSAISDNMLDIIGTSERLWKSEISRMKLQKRKLAAAEHEYYRLAISMDILPAEYRELLVALYTKKQKWERIEQVFRLTHAELAEKRRVAAEIVLYLVNSNMTIAELKAMRLIEKEEKTMSKGKAIIIGIDHGYGYMKTANTIMISGVKQLPVEPPFSNSILNYDHKIYCVGQHRQNHGADKTVNQSYYLLTLAAIAAEMRKRNRRQGDVILAVGLPYSFYSVQNKSFREYLMKNRDAQYSFEGLWYHIHIVDVKVYPQGFPVIAKYLDQMSGVYTIVDIGSRTTEVLTFKDGCVQHEYCFSFERGMIQCIELIQKEFLSKYQITLEEEWIQEILIGNPADGLNEGQKQFIEALTEYFTDEIQAELEAKGINLEIAKVTYCGGGAAIIAKYGKYREGLTEFITDIHANAKGYEYLAGGTMD